MNFDFIVLYYLFFMFYGLFSSYNAKKSALLISVSLFLEAPVAGRILGVW